MSSKKRFAAKWVQDSNGQMHMVWGIIEDTEHQLEQLKQSLRRVSEDVLQHNQ